MQLKSQVEWALHCCAILAGVPDGRYLSTKVLADFHGVPKEYLSKALQTLSTAGIVESTLGPSGGYRLLKSPETVTFLDIVEAVEGRGSTFACTEIRKNNPCRSTDACDDKACGVARVMWEADRAWRDSLRGVTLAALGRTLQETLPEDQLRDSMEWLMARSEK